MPLFWVLVVLGAGLLWFLLSFLYKPIGRSVKETWEDVRDAMSEEDETEN